MIDLEEVSQIKGKATNGRTMESATCDATSSVLIPGLPTAIATAMEGTRPMRRVIKRRKKGYPGLVSKRCSEDGVECHRQRSSIQ